MKKAGWNICGSITWRQSIPPTRLRLGLFIRTNSIFAQQKYHLPKSNITFTKWSLCSDPCGSLLSDSFARVLHHPSCRAPVCCLSDKAAQHNKDAHRQCHDDVLLCVKGKLEAKDFSLRLIFAEVDFLKRHFLSHKKRIWFLVFFYRSCRRPCRVDHDWFTHVLAIPFDSVSCAAFYGHTQLLYQIFSALSMVMYEKMAVGGYFFICG